MIERTFKCNLCKDIRTPDHLHGIYFINDPTWIQFKGAWDCETHICFKCTKAIVMEYAK